MFPVKTIMTKDTITVKKDTPIYEAIERLVNNRISGLPVVDDQQNLVGVLSEYDVLRILNEQDTKKGSTVVGDYMTKNVISFDECATAIDVCDFFIRENKRRVPIVKEGKLVGVVSRHDIIKLIMMMRQKQQGES